MSKITKIVIGIIIIVIFSLTGAMYYWFGIKPLLSKNISVPNTNNSQIQKQEQPVQEQKSEETGKENTINKDNVNLAIPSSFEHNLLDTSSIKKIDDKWNLYTNNKLGFSIKIPQKAFVCPMFSSDYKNNIPVTIFENRNDDFVFIDFAYDDTDGHQKIFNEKLESENNTWEIKVEHVKNDKEMEGVVRNITGVDKTCKLKEKKVGQSLYDIGIENCDYGAWMFRYNSQKSKLAYWYLGYGTNFCNRMLEIDSDTQDYDYDTQMSESFKFL